MVLIFKVKDDKMKNHNQGLKESNRIKFEFIKNLIYSGPSLLVLLFLGIFIASCNMPLNVIPPAPPTEIPSSIIFPPAGAGMLWHDGSVLVYRPSSGSWVSTNEITYDMYAECLAAGRCNDPEGKWEHNPINEENNPQPEFLWKPSSGPQSAPIRDPIAAEEYCGFIGGSGFVTDAVGFLCEIKDSKLYPPRCEFTSVEGGGYIGTHELAHGQLNYLDEYSEPDLGSQPSEISVRSSFCSSDVGGLTLDNFPTPISVTDAGAYRVASDGDDMDCSVVDGRLACTGGKADSAVEITICRSPSVDFEPAAGSAPGTCPAGYLPASDGTCLYSPVGKGLDLAGGEAPPAACEQWMYARDVKDGVCKPIDQVNPCPEAGYVHNRYGTCSPSCSNGQTPAGPIPISTGPFAGKFVDLGTCLLCSAGTSSTGGVCYPCAEGTTSETGGVCKPKAAPAAAPEPVCEYGYIYDVKEGKCKPLAFDPKEFAALCAEAGFVRNFLNECTPRCKDGFAPTKKYTLDGVPLLSCYACPRGTSSIGGVCFLCPEGTTSSEPGEVCKPVISAPTATATASSTLTPVATPVPETISTPSCLPGWVPDPRSGCIMTGPESCGPHAFRDSMGVCQVCMTGKPGICVCSPDFIKDGKCTLWDYGISSSTTPACKNGGIWNETAGTCACIPGYSGITCEKKLCPDSTAYLGMDEKVSPPVPLCAPVSYSWVSSCPAGYHLDEKTGACLALSGKTGCFGYALTSEESSACYPSGCLAGSTFDSNLSCCQVTAPEKANEDSCVTFTVQMPSCSGSIPRPSGGDENPQETQLPPSCNVEPNNPNCVP